ncbi:uncharacterized protein LOC143888872 [Tasmannia lanceolata]|uniref:uncharacterized protein LOC143888872 n=1 Tax=Tasmannia lanceolata TaxID=3420 RepID=UPI00406399A4
MLREERSLLWEELEVVSFKWPHLWCIGGDFNEIRFVEERAGCSHYSQNMKAFADFIASKDLIDLPLLGAHLTWSRNESRSRLDRFLICPRWLEGHQEVCQKALSHSVSDHCPILLDPRIESWGPIPFRFYIAWLEIPKMDEKLGAWWVEHKGNGPADVVIGSELRHVKKKRLRKWKCEMEKEASSRKVWLLERIKSIVEKEEIGAASVEEVEEVGHLKEEHTHFVLLEEISWRQKSRVKWLKEGDKNIAFFHAMASVRRRGNRIEALHVNDEVIDNKEGIIKEIIDYFQSLYTSEGVMRMVPEGVPFMSLSELDQQSLERPFIEEEIERRVFSLGRDKAPGPDGFCIAFFQVCWGYVKEDILRFFEEFHQGIEFDKGIGATFITLIPKVKGGLKASYYRPISSVGCLYKVLAKVLAERLKRVLPKIVSMNQCAFTSDRHIVDCYLIANETIDFYSKMGKEGIMCKLDMEKAYDRVEWDCLDYLLGRMGFGSKWRLWIKTCISSASFSLHEWFIIMGYKNLINLSGFMFEININVVRPHVSVGS